MMRFIALRLAIVGGAIALVAAPALAQTPTPQAPAPQAPAPQVPAPGKIAVIDLQTAMVSTQEGEAAVGKLNAEFFQPRNAELEALQAEVQDLQNRLSQGANTLSETAQADLQKEIDAKNKTLQRKVEDFQAESDEQQRVVLDDLTAKMRAVLNDYLTSNGYSILLDARSPNSGLVWASETIDITPQVIEAYNKKHPVAGTAPAPAAAAPATAPGTAAPKPAPEIPTGPGAPGTPPAK